MPSLHPNRPASLLGIMVDWDPTVNGAICAKVRTDRGGWNSCLEILERFRSAG